VGPGAGERRRCPDGPGEGQVAEAPGGRIEPAALTERFAEVAVVEIDLQAASGEFFSLLGPAGCGKTTTPRLIADSSSAGKSLLDDVDVGGVPLLRPDGSSKSGKIPHEAVNIIRVVLDRDESLLGLARGLPLKVPAIS